MVLCHLNAEHLRVASMTRDTGLGHADHMMQGAFPIKATQSFLTKADSRYLRFVTWRSCHGQQGGSRPAVVDLRILVSFTAVCQHTLCTRCACFFSAIASLCTTVTQPQLATTGDKAVCVISTFQGGVISSMVRPTTSAFKRDSQTEESRFAPRLSAADCKLRKDGPV